MTQKIAHTPSYTIKTPSGVFIYHKSFDKHHPNQKIIGHIQFHSVRTTMNLLTFKIIAI